MSEPFREALLREIAKQEALIKRMDSPEWGGIMGQIRAERLDLLNSLLAFEPDPPPSIRMTIAIEAALRELLRLKDLKTDAEAINTSGNWEAAHRQRDMRAEYEKAKPLAWDAARRALTQSDASAEQTE